MDKRAYESITKRVPAGADHVRISRSVVDIDYDVKAEFLDMNGMVVCMLYIAPRVGGITIPLVSEATSIRITSGGWVVVTFQPNEE